MPIRGADPRRRPAPETGLDGVVPVVEDGALLVFSGVEAVRRWRETARFVTARSDEIAGVARRVGASEIVQDVAGPVRMRTPVAGTGAVGSPPFDVRGLSAPLRGPDVDRLRELLSAHPPIEKAWVVEATVDALPVAVAAFQVEPGQDDVVRGLVPAVVPLLPVDLYGGVQVLVLHDNEVGRAIPSADEPLYVRPRA